MTVGQQETQNSVKRKFISLEFKGIFYFQDSSDYSSPILQTFDDLGGVSLFQGNQSKNSIRNTY